MRSCQFDAASGWHYAPGPKNLEQQTSPYLLSWEELSEDIKELDRRTVRDMPGFLAEAGFQIYRLRQKGAR